MPNRQYKHYDCIHINMELDAFIQTQLQAFNPAMSVSDFYQALAQLNDEFGAQCRRKGANQITLSALNEHYPNAAPVTQYSADILDEDNCPVPISMLLLMLDELGLAPCPRSDDPARNRARTLLHSAQAAA